MAQVAGCKAKLRENADGSPYVTDNSNYIVDLYFDTPIKDAKVPPTSPPSPLPGCLLLHTVTCSQQ